MSPVDETTTRRLGPGDEAVVRKLARNEAQTAFLADDGTIFIAAFQGAELVGFVFGYVLPRRHGDPSILFVYELYRSLGGHASKAVMWDFEYTAS